jgi:hypothetical protein
MTSKQFDILRLMQWLIPALVTLFGAFDKAFGWGVIGTVETLASAVVAFIGVVAQHSSAQYFSTKTIVTKILPDKEDGEEAE